MYVTGPTTARRLNCTPWCDLYLRLLVHVATITNGEWRLPFNMFVGRIFLISMIFEKDGCREDVYFTQSDGPITTCSEIDESDGILVVSQFEMRSMLLADTGEK